MGATPDQASLGTVERTLLVVVVVAGLVLRGWGLGDPVFWADEAESSINALSILEHGVPSSEYLGIPIYENMLTVPWPDHPEYEFRDSSYSERGYPVYHGWLPLYAIAGSFLIAGVAPDTGRELSDPRLDPDEFRYRTAAARAPALLFSALFLVLAFLCARSLCGRDAGWTALVVAATSDRLVWAGRQARYYSATLALSLGVLWALIRIVKRGHWRDYVLGAITFALLFHTHLLATAALAAVFGLTLPWQLKRPGAWPKLAVFTVICLVAAVPWMVLTGFLGRFGEIPRAWPIVDLPDVLRYAFDRADYLVLLSLASAVLAGTACSSVRSMRFVRPFVAHRRAVLLIVAWAFVAFGLFFAMIPAASMFPQRLSMLLQAPMVVLVGVTVACGVRGLLGRPSAVWSSIIALAVLHAVGSQQRIDYSRRWDYPSLQVAAVLKDLPLTAQTRLYATPNGHLILTFYTGLPFQSIAPVSKEFLDHYAGDIVFFDELVELIEPGDPLSAAGIRSLASGSALSMSEEEADAWTDRLSIRIPREDYAGNVAGVHPPLEELAPPWSDAVRAQRRLQRERTDKVNARLAANPLFRGATIETPSDQWQAFFYRFADYESRRGARSNYADRMRNATARFTPHLHWIVYHSLPPL